MTIALLVAMSSEWNLLNSILNEQTGIFVEAQQDAFGKLPLVSGSLGTHKLLVAQSGIGKVNAAVTATALLHQYHPDCLISMGVAGALIPEISVMDTVVSTAVAYHDVDCGPGNLPGQVQGLPARFEADAALLAQARSLTLPSAPADTQIPAPRLHSGLIASGDCFIQTAEQRGAILKTQPDAIAVDMESGALAQTCLLHNIPFLCFRMISDTPGAKDHYRAYENFWQSMAGNSVAIAKAFLETFHDACHL